MTHAGKTARWFCTGCVDASFLTPPKHLVACSNCCGWKKPRDGATELAALKAAKP